MPHEPKPEEMEGIRRALSTGNKIAAIKIYRESVGCDLREARDYIDALHQSILENPPVVTAEMAGVSQVDLEEVRRLAASGSTIHAIKRYRELTGTGLAEAKEFVEGMFRGRAQGISVPMQLMDAAFELTARHASDDAVADFDRRWRRYSEAERNAAIKAANDLMAVTFTVCEQLRERRIAQTEAETRMKKECPGFSDETYRAALGLGRRDSR
jgi:ribosomal protein L7/L12